MKIVCRNIVVFIIMYLVFYFFVVEVEKMVFKDILIYFICKIILILF